MLDLVRTTLFRAITTPRGDRFAPLRIPKDLVRRMNTALGRPLCPPDELAKRREASARLAVLRSGTGNLRGPAADRGGSRGEAAPVLLYFEKDRNPHELKRMREALDAKSIPYKMLDVSGDAATIEFVTRKANCKADDLPVVFVADTPIGAYPALVEADVSGALSRAIYGAN
jgi:hypothetical protein